MFNYALKRIARGWKGFIAFFFGITIAATLFSGTLFSADSVGHDMLDQAMDLVPVDLIVADELRDIYKYNPMEVEASILEIPGVVDAEQVVRWQAPINPVTQDDPHNATEFTIAALEENSTLWRDVFGPDIPTLDFGEIYIERESFHASQIEAGQNVTLHLFTYEPTSGYPSFETFYLNLTVGGFVDIDLESYAKITGESPFFVRSILLGTDQSLRKPPHDLLFMNRDTLVSILEVAYLQNRHPTKVVSFEILLDLDDASLVNPWDIGRSLQRVQSVSEQIDNEVKDLELHSWQNFIQDILTDVKSVTDSFKTRFIFIALPVFFTAWYMGVTVSDVMLGSRRREVGLLLTKGFTRRQIFLMFLFETGLIGLLSGVTALGVSIFLVPALSIGNVAFGEFSFLSWTSVVAVLLFSSVISLLSVLAPSWSVTRMNVIDALMEHRTVEEEELPSRLEPAVALTLGLYKLLMLLLGLSVETFRPVGGGMVINVLYFTWWGFDLILGYVGPILFFWGFTKLFVQGSFHIQELFGRVVGSLVGDISKISMLSARRSLKRTAAVSFLIALIFGYSVSVIGGLATLSDSRLRTIQMNVGADAAVWVFDADEAPELVERISALDGVASVALEQWFLAETAFLMMQPRAVDPLVWPQTAYYEESWFAVGSETAFQLLSESNETIILDRGLAQASGLIIGSDVTFKIRHNLYSTATVVDLLGPVVPEGGEYQALPSFVPEGFRSVSPASLEITKARILVRFEPGADPVDFEASVAEMGDNIEAIYTVAEVLEGFMSNIFVQGPMQVQQLGIIFSTLVSSIGVILVISTTLMERRKEITLMVIRGFSVKQLIQMLLVENFGIVSFSMLLGAVVGYINIVGDVAITNASGGLIMSRIVFPTASLMFIGVIVASIILSVVIPIIVSSRQNSAKPQWRLVE
jgi:ABC-type antimicrobial peptide transport system permease subunit